MDQQFKSALEEARKESVVALTAKDLQISADSEDVSLMAQSAEDELARRKHKTHSRKIWGRVLLTMVVCGFSASYLIVIAIGLKWLKYDDSQFAVPSVIAAGIIGTYGLAKIAVNYFFTD